MCHHHSGKDPSPPEWEPPSSFLLSTSLERLVGCGSYMGLPVQCSLLPPSLAPPTSPHPQHTGPVKHCSTSHLGGCCVSAQPGRVPSPCPLGLPSSWTSMPLPQHFQTPSSPRKPTPPTLFVTQQQVRWLNGCRAQWCCSSAWSHLPLASTRSYGGPPLSEQ